MHTIVEEGLADEAFIRERTENYAALKELVARYTPKKVALVTRIAAETIRDLWIIMQLARRIGLRWNYVGPRDVFAEIRQATASMAGITWERLEAEGSCTYPLVHEGDPGEPVILIDSFPSGRAFFAPAAFSDAAELPDERFPSSSRAAVDSNIGTRGAARRSRTL